MNFSQQDLERLYITYKSNPKNYYKIKEKMIGSMVIASHKKHRKSAAFFFGAVSFIIAVGSSFAAFSGHENSLVALFIIWCIALATFLVWWTIHTRTRMQQLKEDQAFFEKFELISERNPSPEAFLKHW